MCAQGLTPRRAFARLRLDQLALLCTWLMLGHALAAEPLASPPSKLADENLPAREQRVAPMVPPAPSPEARWLNEVRAQRQALQEQRRAAHEARREAIDPVGAARREERQEQIQRRRKQVRQFIEQERRLYLNSGPWLMPLATQPLQGPSSLAPPNDAHAEKRPPVAPLTPAPTQAPAPVQAPLDWDNRWYYNGW